MARVGGRLMCEFFPKIICKICGVFNCLAIESIALPLKKSPDLSKSNKHWFSSFKNVVSGKVRYSDSPYQTS